MSDHEDKKDLGLNSDTKRSVSVAQLDEDIKKKKLYLPYKCLFRGNQISRFSSKLVDFFSGT